MKYTVKQLIDELSAYNPDAEVSFELIEGCCGDYEQLGDPEIFMTEPDAEFLRIEFSPLWYSDSCITARRAKDAALKHKQAAYGDNWKPGMPNKAVK